MIHRTPSVLTLRDKKEHSYRRRLIGEGLSDVALRTYEPAILSHCQTALRLLAPQCAEGKRLRSQVMHQENGLLRKT